LLGRFEPAKGRAYLSCGSWEMPWDVDGLSARKSAKHSGTQAHEGKKNKLKIIKA